MILDKNNEFEAFEKIKEYILNNQIKELYGDAKVVSEAINNKFESTIITTIDLSIETLLVTKKRQTGVLLSSQFKHWKELEK